MIDYGHNRPPLLVRSGRRPFQTVVLASCVLSGGFGLFAPGTRSNAIEKAMPGGLTLGWYIGLLAFGAFTLAVTHQYAPPTDTVEQRERLRFRLQLEAVGLSGLALIAVGYAAAALTVSGGAGLTAALSIGLYTAACGWRIAEIVVDARKMAAAERDPQFAAPPPLGDPWAGDA